jgi:hypothetical protein
VCRRRLRSVRRRACRRRPRSVRRRACRRPPRSARRRACRRPPRSARLPVSLRRGPPRRSVLRPAFLQVAARAAARVSAGAAKR